MKCKGNLALANQTCSKNLHISITLNQTKNPFLIYLKGNQEISIILNSMSLIDMNSSLPVMSEIIEANLLNQRAYFQILDQNLSCNQSLWIRFSFENAIFIPKKYNLTWIVSQNCSDTNKNLSPLLEYLSFMLLSSMQSFSYFIHLNATVPLEEILSEVVRAKNSCFISLNNHLRLILQTPSICIIILTQTYPLPSIQPFIQTRISSIFHIICRKKRIVLSD